MSALGAQPPSPTRTLTRKRLRSSFLQPVPPPALVLTPPSTSTSLSAAPTPATPLAMDSDAGYFSAHAASPSLWAGLWPDKDPDEQPDRKRRRGVAGAILSTALDAALFTSAVGYAAYQIWCGKPLEDGPEDVRRRLIQAPPPPYEPCDPRSRPRAAKRPSATRQPTRVHQPRPSPSPTPHRTPRRQRTPVPASASASTPTPDPSAFNFVLRPKPASQRAPQTSPEEDLMGDFVCSLQPYERPASAEPEDDEDAADDDEQMRAFKAQIRGLINDGHAALAARPELPTPMRQLSRPTAISPATPAAPATVAAVAAANLSTDEDVRILQNALEQASIGTRRNWWEQAQQRH